MQKFIYTNSNGESVELTNSRPYFVENEKTEGLGVPKNTIYTQKSMNQDGVSILGDDLEVRYINLSGTIVADSTEEAFTYRKNLIKILNPKLDGTLKFISDIGEKIINCKIEQAPLFSGSNSRIPKFTINFFCPSPFWQDVAEIKSEIALWKGDFSFELELIDGGIEFGHREPSLIVNVENIGDVEAGIRIDFKALATVKSPSLLNVNTQEIIKINKTMVAGEIITITTGFGNKRVESSLSGVTTNAFNFIDINSTFLQLELGDNLFRYNAEQGLDNLEVNIYHSNNYLGV